MCWVMPPASPATTSVSRIASSSDVLPWSTWPMIVTTGGRGSRSSSASSNSASASTSSAAWTISISLSNSSARTWIASSDSVWVSVAISPSCISFLITSGTGTPRYSATSLTVEPELTRMVVGLEDRRVLRRGLLVGAAPAAAAAPRGPPLGAPPGPPGPPPGPCRREACESITTRRTPPAEPGARSPWSESRVGRWRRCWPSGLAPGRRRPAAQRGLSPRLALGRPLRARTVERLVERHARANGARTLLLLLAAVGLRLGRLARERAVRGVLVDGGGGGLDLDAVRSQPLEHLRGGHVVLLG